MSMQREEILESIEELVAGNRDQCLWFWRDDFSPADDPMRLKALEYIQRHGAREAALRAAQLTQWLLRTSSGTSAAS
jgi:hypothetical protein